MLLCVPYTYLPIYLAGLQVSLLEQYFFPQWHAVLRHWLANSPNYDEVTRWYLGWKSLFPQDLLDHERVRAQMGAALNLMNTAVDHRGPAAAGMGAVGGAAGWAGGAPLPPEPEPPLPPPLPPKQAQQQQPAFDPSSLSLRQLVEHYAAEAGVEFLPKPGRTHEGMQASAVLVALLSNVACIILASYGLLGAWCIRVVAA